MLAEFLNNFSGLGASAAAPSRALYLRSPPAAGGSVADLSGWLALPGGGAGPFATLHLQGGTDPIRVSTQLGHHSVAFTISTYAHLPMGDRGGHADRIASAPKRTRTTPVTPSAKEAPTTDPAPALVAQG